MNIFSNFIPNKKVIFADKEWLYWSYKSGCTDINYHERNDATKFVTEIVHKRK